MIKEFKEQQMFSRPLATFLFYEWSFYPPEKSKNTDKLVKELLFYDGVKESKVRGLFDKLQEYRPNLIRILVKEELEKYIDDDEIREDWVSSLEGYQYHRFPKSLNSIEVYSMLETCRQIEAVVPKGCERLNKLFGITHIARYPHEMLLEQLNDWDNYDDSPYGVIVSAWDDWNNAFAHAGGSDPDLNGHFGINRHLYLDLKKLGYKFRAIEVKNKEEFITRQLFLGEHFAQAGKFQFLHIAAHGSPEGIHLGRGENDKVRTEDIRLLMKDLAPLYIPHMETVFKSCSTGTKLGFASKWASLGSDICAVAPDQNGSIKSIYPLMRGG